MNNEKTCTSCKRTYKSEQDFMTDTSRWRLCSNGHLWFNCSCNSTLVLVKGKFSWYSPDLFMTKRAQSVFNKIAKNVKIPYISSVVMELEEALRSEHSTSSQLAAIVRQEPMIGANILEAANLRVIGQGKQGIHTLEHAITYLGRHSVMDIVLLAGMMQFEINTHSYVHYKHWHEALLVGLIAERMRTYFESTITNDEAFLAGSLCNIGKIIGAIIFPAETDKVYDYANSTKHLCSWRESERLHAISPHETLGEIAIGLWGLPKFLYDAVGHHRLDEGKTSKFRRLISFANEIGHIVRLEPHRVNEPVLAEHKKFLGINSEQQLDKLIADLLPLENQVEENLKCLKEREEKNSAKKSKIWQPGASKS